MGQGQLLKSEGPNTEQSKEGKCPHPHYEMQATSEEKNKKEEEEEEEETIKKETAMMASALGATTRTRPRIQVPGRLCRRHGFSMNCTLTVGSLWGSDQ